MEAHAPAPYDKDVLMAVRAFLAGEASKSQQVVVADWIISQVCNYYDLSYRAGGEEGRRSTDFHEGRRFVGAQIIKMSRPETLKAIEMRAAKLRSTKRIRGKRQEAKND